MGALRTGSRDRSRKPKPASASLFEWAFSREQKREAGPVGGVLRPRRIIEATADVAVTSLLLPESGLSAALDHHRLSLPLCAMS